MAAVTTEPAGRIVVETRGLKKTYFAKVATPVLHGIDLAIREGEFIAIIGQSGSGKSTLLNILGALDVPTEGQVLIDGVDIATLSEDQLASLRKRVVGFCVSVSLSVGRTDVPRERADAGPDQQRRSECRGDGTSHRAAGAGRVGRPAPQTSGYDERWAEPPVRNHSRPREPTEDRSCRRADG
jgi:ATPase subunit of ABC transporter with duplicated ATPase domains